MYLLGPVECLNIGVRVDSVESVANRYHGEPELRIEATLRLSPNSNRHVCVVLWAPDDEREHYTVEKDFVDRDIILTGHCPDDHENPYSRQRAGISHIWFNRESEILATVKAEIV